MMELIYYLLYMLEYKWRFFYPILFIITLTWCGIILIYRKKHAINRTNRKKLPIYFKIIGALLIILHLGYACYHSFRMYEGIKINQAHKKWQNEQDLAMERFNNWLEEEKRFVDEIGEMFIFLKDKKEIEAECIKLANTHSHITEVYEMYVAFSDDSFISSMEWDIPETWDPPEMLNPTEEDWYALAMNSGGKAIASELYMLDYTNKMMVSVLKNIGTINGLDAVLGIDVFVPDELDDIARSIYWRLLRQIS